MAEGHEVESTLMIRSTSPAEVADRVAGLGSLGEFLLRAREGQSIRDVYLDLPDRSLGEERIALRVRRLNGSTLLTLKADARLSAGVADRVEIEAPWSSDALARVLQELAKRDVPVRGPAAVDPQAAPSDALAALGLEVIQERETRRRPRDVVPMEGYEPVAELAIDHVSYLFPMEVVRLHEVEVEAKGRGTQREVERVISTLKARFPDELQPWPHGKLATGMAIQALVAEEGLKDVVDRSAALVPAAVERLEERLGSGQGT